MRPASATTTNDPPPDRQNPARGKAHFAALAEGTCGGG
jgi:hypothetical protein